LFERLHGVRAGELVREPSAGRGRLADEARRRGGHVTCVEIQHELCATLRQKGHEVVEGDFLKMTPAQLGLFDVIVMNPPFDRGRDCDHVRHALQFLKPGGRLVSVMSARTEFAEDRRTASFRAVVEKMEDLDRCWRGRAFNDLPAGSFKEAGTMVNTLTVAVRKPEAQEAAAA
jgi:predicted RNA methylase